MPRSIRSIHALVIAALLVVPAFLFVSYTREFLAADSVLDAGVSYDYIAGHADFADNHPYIPYAQRHQTLLVIAGLSFAAAVLYSLYAIFFARATRHI